MTENLIVGIFNVESEGFQAMTELKQQALGEKSLIFQAVLAKKENGKIKVLDTFDTGAATVDDTLVGDLVGARSAHQKASSLPRTRQLNTEN